jgi:hypothetical protein
MTTPITIEVLAHHFERAEALLADFRSLDAPANVVLTEALVHATLAHAAAEWLGTHPE